MTAVETFRARLRGEKQRIKITFPSFLSVPCWESALTSAYVRYQTRRYWRFEWGHSMNVSISRWVLKNTNKTELQPSRPLVPSANTDPYSALSAERQPANPTDHNAFNQCSLSAPPLHCSHPSFSPPSLRIFTWLLLSCHHSHLNPVRRGPDRADWFPVRRCLLHVVELSRHVHPPLLHSNLKGRPCLLFRLCCRRSHTHKIHKSLHTETHTRTEPRGANSTVISLFAPSLQRLLLIS